MQRLEAAQRLLRALGQSGEGVAGMREQGIAANRRNFDAMEHGHAMWMGDICVIGVPHVADAGEVIDFLYQPADLRKSFDMAQRGLRFDHAEAIAQRKILLRRERLFAKEDHAPAIQRFANGRIHGVAVRPGQVDIQDLRADNRC